MDAELVGALRCDLESYEGVAGGGYFGSGRATSGWSMCVGLLSRHVEALRLL